MSLSAKWTAVSLFALTALAAGTLAAGCTVTSGTPSNIEGGTGNNPPTDGGGGTDTSTADTSTANACPAIATKQTVKFKPPACQAAAENECCAEMTACFDQAGVDPLQDCNVYTACLDNCAKPLADGGTPTTAEIAQCQADDCDSNSPKSVQDAHEAMITCLTAKPGTSVACQ
jgi:hypothetical protein